MKIALYKSTFTITITIPPTKRDGRAVLLAVAELLVLRRWR